MNTMKIKYMVSFGFIALLLAGCDLGMDPYNGKSNEQALDSVQGMEAATRGNYQILVGSGYYSYSRSLYNMNEFPADNVSMSGTTTDPLFYAYNYDHFPNMSNSEDLWRWGYEIIVGANKVLEAIGEQASEETDQIKGENLFLRALAHYHLVNLYGRPYVQSPTENPGIPIVDFTDIEQRPERATVAAVYDFMINDLSQAAELMGDRKSSSFASTEVAYALLSRIYLNMEENELAVEYANKVINSGRYQLVGTQTFREYFTLPNENNPETIFAIKHTEEDDHGFGNVGSMYYRSDDGVGWGEMYASESYRKALDRFPEDARHAFIDPQYQRDESGNIETDDNGDPLLQKRNGYPRYYVNKFSFQQGIVSLSSPVILRLAEIYLNRAEANAKLGNTQAAIEDVNRIRSRAGLTENALYSAGDYKHHDSLIDVVLEERRLELAFEGKRKYDLLRNRRSIVRNYPGTHLAPGEETEVIQPDDPRIVFYLPQAEIELNDNLVQNP